MPLDLKLTNNMNLYLLSMGKVFRVVAICDTADEANAVSARNPDHCVIGEDKAGRVYLAERYGAVAPSAVLKDARGEPHGKPYGR